MNRTPELLVSVRSVAEAEAALEGGAHLIDVKEPRHGALGRAGDAVIAGVVGRVAGRRPVSAALGELTNPAEAHPYPGTGLAYVKWGLSGMGDRPDWPERWQNASRRVAAASPACRVVAVAYADWQRAGAPSVEEVSAFARAQPGGVLLVDTFQKAPRPETGAAPALVDLLPLAEVVRLCGSCHEAGVRVALAGSLGAAQIERLRPARPDWFAVRGAACAGGRREAAVCARKVRELVGLLG
jgi:uncharacterized protein (UPF0264 family)